MTASDERSAEGGDPVDAALVRRDLAALDRVRRDLAALGDAVGPDHEVPPQVTDRVLAALRSERRPPPNRPSHP